MADEKPITKLELLKILKDVGIATKNDVHEIVTKEVSGTKIGISGIIEEKINGLERRLKRRMGKEHNEIKARIAQLATTTPTYDELRRLKDKVDRYHPSN